jgi:ABC-2 type transport system ATP-binding protein
MDIGQGAAVVAVDDLIVDRGGRRVLDGVSLTVAAGTVTGLLGPSGSGKTTLMRAIVGVQQISRGRVTVLGHPAGSPGLRRLVGYVTQAPSVYGDLTVVANARYFAAVYGADDEAAMAAIGDVGLTDRADQHAEQLSGGELARLSLACALVAAPMLLVLDEPTVGLDPVLRADLWAHFHRLADSGVTLLVSSHVMDEADRCDRLLLLRDGQLLADDTPHGLRASTVTDDLEGAFLHLIRTQGRVA